MKEFLKLLKVAKGLSVLSLDYNDDVITLFKCFEISKKDQFGTLILSKLENSVDRIKSVYLAYFLIKKPNLKWVDYYRLIENLYVLEYDLYEDTDSMDVDCGGCYGSGYENCDECGGDGEEDCSYCDGDGKVECNDCWGEGKVDCDECGGSGEVEEEGDDGETEKVSCENCDGDGEVSCRNCGGQGTYDCDECDSRGSVSCKNCGGSGEEYCGWCNGSGEVKTENEHYEIRNVYVVLFGKKMEDYVGKIIPLSEFNELDYEFEYDKKFNQSTRFSDEDVDETNNEYGMDEPFVEILGLEPLKNQSYLRF